MRSIKYLLVAFLLVAFTPCLQAQLTETHSFPELHKPVPDGNAAGVSHVTTLTSAISCITSVKVRLKINGEFNGDLYGYLTHGSGFTVLLNRPGRSPSNLPGYDDSGFDITLDDAAATDLHHYRTVTTPAGGMPLTGAWKPDGRNVDPGVAFDESILPTTTLAAFNDLPASGGWTLYLADLESGGTNLLVSWELELTGLGTPLVTWSNPADIVYGTALGAAQLGATATVPGSFAYTPAGGTALDSGNAQVLSVIFTPSDLGSYKKVTNAVAINVTQAPLTVAAANAVRLYGDANPAFTGTITGTQLGDLLLDSYATAATETSAVGDYDIVPAVIGDKLTNYLVTLVSGTLMVNPAPLTVMAADATRVYGDVNPALSGTILGIKNSETITATYATAAMAASPVGFYAIVPALAGETLVNYQVTTINGTLTVTAAPMIITAADATRLYGQANPVFSGTIAGIKNSEAISATYSTAADAASAVGMYPIIPVAVGSTLANYAITLNNGALTIMEAASTGVVSSSLNPAPPGQAVTFSVTLSAVAPGAGTPTGIVQFRIAGSPAGAPATLAGGVATYSTATLALGAHTVVAEYAGDGNFTGTTNQLTPDQVINTPPVAVNDIIERYPTNGVKVKLTALLGNDSDADGDTLAITVSALSQAGGTVTVSGAWVFYTPPAGHTTADSFTYTIADGRGGEATGTVQVNIKGDDGATDNLTIVNLSSGTYRLIFNGIPGRTYRIQYTDNLSPPDWLNLELAPAARTVNEFGIFTFEDTLPEGVTSRFYRSVYP